MGIQYQAPVAGAPLLVHSFDEWRLAARALLAHKVAPHLVQWLSHKDDGDLFSHAAEAQACSAVKQHGAPVRISRKLMDMLQTAACCRVPNRWAFLYLVLWRWQQGEKEVVSGADPDGARLHAMVKAVHREQHAMHACIRFRERKEEAGAPRFVAWCEPAHDVLPQVARHFAARMGRITWMIATPEASVMWDGAALHSTGPLMRGPEDIDDAGAALWLAYHRSILNPARLNADLMQDPVAPGALDACRRCALWQGATQAVPGVGPRTARIMLVGGQPGDREDLAGRPFVGPAGQLLERALARARLARRAVYLTDAVKHFKWEPRGKRRMHKAPAQREIEACSYWLDGELARVAPRVVVALGSTALKAVTANPHATLKDAMGAPFRHQGRWIVAACHPSYVLRVPGGEAKAEAFDALAAALREAKRLAG
jgi:uracil-DNA glycosylase family protein